MNIRWHRASLEDGEIDKPDATRVIAEDRSGAPRAKQYLIIDRDTKYTAQFRRLMRDSGSDPATAALAESECVRGTFRAFD